MTPCRWSAHSWGEWWPARLGMLRRTCEHCGVLQHTWDRYTARRIRGQQ